MNAYLPFETIEFWQTAGWTMVHFLWLGTLAALAAWIFRLLLRRRAPNVRYASALFWLAVLAALPVAIAAWLIQTSPPSQRGAGGGFAVQTHRLTSPDALSIPAAATPRIIELNTPDAAQLTPPAISSTPPTVPLPISESPEEVSLPYALAALDSFVPYLPWLWIIGAPITFALLAAGFIGTKRLRRASRPIEEPIIADILGRLSNALRITRRVSIAVCDRIAAPVLVGIVRPIILLPPAALTGWSPDEIEMVLLHELAHVRRWDNLVNLVQRIVESLLFFHPAVWLVSSWVRSEREACCDAIVVARTQHPHAYAELLVTLAAQAQPSPSGRGQGEGARNNRRNKLHLPLTSAMAAGPLRSRIRRILNLEDDPMLISGKSFTLVVASLLTAAVLAVLYLPTIGQAEESATEATESTEYSPSSNNGSEQPKASRRAPIAETQNNLKHLALALLNYEATYRALPPHAIYGDDGKPLLSWRVLILPFLDPDHAKLYEEFHLDEPWNSKHNVKLLPRMPEVFKNPKFDNAVKTNYLAVVGKECVFDGTPDGIKLQQIVDGTSRTIALVEADKAVEWTKPEDWQFDRTAPTSGLGELWGGRWHAAWIEGHVRGIMNREPPDLIGIQFTRAGGETRSLKESEGRSSEAQHPGEMGMRYGELGMSMGEMGGDFGGEMGMGRMAGGPMGMESSDPSMSAANASRKFPSLEEQKLADIAYRRLGWELEPIGDDDLARVQALGYAGGIRVAHAPQPGGSGSNISYGSIQAGDILVGLHVWPTRNLQDVVEVINRDDLAELDPIKFYVVREEQILPPQYTIETGRISVRKSEPKEQDAPGSMLTPTKGKHSRSAPTPSPYNPYESPRSGPEKRDVTAETPYGTFIKSRPQASRALPTPPALATPPSSTQSDTSKSGIPRNWLAQTQSRVPPISVTEAERAELKENRPVDKSALRYDGKTFDQWQNAWRTELSTEKRLEAVNALAAFGANGYGPEAAEAILDVARQYDWSSMDDRGAILKLKEACREAFNPFSTGLLSHQLPPDVALAVLLASAESEDVRTRYFVVWQLGFFVYEYPQALDALLKLSRDENKGVRGAAFQALPILAGKFAANEKLLARVEEGLASEDPGMQIEAIKKLNVQLMVPGYSGAEADRATLYYIPELFPKLFSADENVRRWARAAVGSLHSKDAPQIVEQLLNVLNDENREKDHIEAIRALAAMAKHAKVAMPELEERLRRAESKENILAILVAMQRIQRNGEQPFDIMRYVIAMDEAERKPIIREMGEPVGGPRFYGAIKKEDDKLFPSDSIVPTFSR